MDGVIRVPIDHEILVQRVYEAVVGPGDIALDAGAHTGRHTLPLARQVGPSGVVHAFEPLPPCRQALAGALGDLAGQVCLHDCALGAADARAEFVVAVDRLPESGLRPRQYDGPTRLERIAVQVRTVDGVLADLRSLRFVKIDAEGGELDILRGAVATLRRHRPVIAFEFGMRALGHYDSSPGAMYDFLTANGYLLYGIDGVMLGREEFAASAERQVIYDYVAVPREDAAARAAVEQALNRGLYPCLRARAAAMAAGHHAARVGEVPVLARYPSWLRPLGRGVAACVLFFARVFLNPQRLSQGAVLATLDSLIEACRAMERDLQASNRRIHELEARLDRIERRQRPAA